MSFFHRVRQNWPIFALGAVVLALSLALPSVSNGIFASPDETAVAVSVRQLAKTGSAAFVEPLAPSFPWLHPRSYVATGESIVPIGFLGWPSLLALVSLVLPFVALPWFASVMAVSGLVPWYLLLRRKYGATAAWWGTALAWTFPPVLLYLNRSFFTHLPQISLVLWAIWLWIRTAERTELTARLTTLRYGLVGVLFGLALSFRPIEVMWLLPVTLVLVAQMLTWSWRQVRWVLLGMVVGLLPLFIVQARTYGAWFEVGYWMRANEDPAAVLASTNAPQAARPWYFAIAPYGLHPHSILWNVRSFFIGALWPWMLASAAMCMHWLMSLRGRRVFSWRSIVGLGVAATLLLLVYGSGLYADHVQGVAITLGNSFLRYTLPFGFAVAWAFAAGVRRLEGKRAYPQARLACSVVAAVLVVCGVYGAFFYDDESILATRRELVRYEAIRATAAAAFAPSDILLSERSDKIFFPVMRVASPLPTADQLKAFARRTVATSTALGLFGRPLSLQARDEWRRIGYDVYELPSFGRERLYRLTPFSR